MLSRLRRNNREGFTIIEVLIVLAIAGLILLIVFLAVPALQRNASNTNRKNDASAIAAAVSEYENNNSGTLPSEISGTGGTYTLCSSVDTNCTGGTDSPAQFKLGHYNTPNTSGGNGDFEIVTTKTAAGNYDQLYIETKLTCSGNAPTATGAGAQSVAIVYNIATGTGSSGYNSQCLTAS